MQNLELYGDLDWYVNESDVVYECGDDALKLKHIHNQKLIAVPDQVETELGLRKVIAMVVSAK